MVARINCNFGNSLVSCLQSLFSYQELQVFVIYHLTNLGE